MFPSSRGFGDYDDKFIDPHAEITKIDFKNNNGKDFRQFTVYVVLKNIRSTTSWTDKIYENWSTNFKRIYNKFILHL